MSHARRRLNEAARLGFTRAVVPANSPDLPDGIRQHRVATLTEALAAAGLLGEQPPMPTVRGLPRLGP